MGLYEVVKLNGSARACCDGVAGPRHCLEDLPCERIEWHDIGHACMVNGDHHRRHGRMRYELTDAPLESSMLVAAGTRGSTTQGPVLLAVPL